MSWASAACRVQPAALRRCAALLGLPLALQPRPACGHTTASHCTEAGGGSQRPAVAGAPGLLRLVQYNVKGLTANDGTSAVATVGSSLRALQGAIVCLNEVDLRRQPEALQSLAEAAGTPHVHFFGHVGGRYGNALLSRFPIRHARDVHLDGGTEVEWPRGSGQSRRIRRGMLAATLALPPELLPAAAQGEAAGEDALLTVFCTHLDHMDEAQRVVQVSHALGEMRAHGGPHLLVGDLNALDANDYSPAEWAALERKAVENGWTAPSDAACVRLLLREGYVDTFRGASGAGAGGPLPEGEAKFTAHTERPMYRIDYALLSPCAAAAGLQPAGAFVDSSAEGSDHFPLVVDLAWGQAAGLGGAAAGPKLPARL